jgi:hypothetical protein
MRDGGRGRAPGGPVDLRCGGQPSFRYPEKKWTVHRHQLAEGTKLARYADEAGTIEVLCTVPGPAPRR